jgi:hypothetical protein
MKRGAYKSSPLPITWTQAEYMNGKNEVIWIEDQVKEPIDLNMAYEFLLKRGQFKDVEGDGFIPSKQLFLPIDANQVLQSGTLPAERASEIIPQINIDLAQRRLTKSELMILEMLRTNNWKRPMYFAVTVGDDYYLSMSDHFELTGLAYQILPVGQKGAGSTVNTKEMYENLMTKFRFGNINDPKVYIDENTMRMCRTHRMMFSQLVGALYSQGDSVKALKALDYCQKMIPGNTVPHDHVSTMLAEYYYKLGETQKGDKIMDDVAKSAVENLNWYFSLTSAQRASVNNRISHNMAVLNQVLRICDQEKQKSILDKYLPIYIGYTKGAGADI